MSRAALWRRRDVWRRKPILRMLYGEWYRTVVSHLQPGLTLEVGGGSGNLKEFAAAVICTDVVEVPWLDAVADAQRLPFASGSLANVVLFDALHHIERPRLFFEEAVRVLRPGGRLVVMDPYISWLSWPVYRFLHPEPMHFSGDLLTATAAERGRQPVDANQAVATILFERSFDDFQRRYPQLRKLAHQRHAFFAYPLSGGFDRPSLLPLGLVRPLLALERALGSLGRILAFRVLVVLERLA